MSCLSPNSPNCVTSSTVCPDKFGCTSGKCPDFQIKRHDTRPAFKINIEDEDGPIDLTDHIVEVNMWAKAKLKSDIDADDTSIAFADGIGFEQVLVGDIIIFNRVRSPEKVLVTGFDETNKLIFVERGHDDTTPSSWKKGTVVYVFRVVNATAISEMTYEDITQMDGTILCDQLKESSLIYEWSGEDTCVPGCFFFEFKLLSMSPSSTSVSVTSCSIGEGVEWVRRYPWDSEGYIISITNTFTQG